MTAIGLARTLAFSHPLLLTIAVLAAASLAPRGWRRTLSPRATRALAATVVAAYVAIVAWYLAVPQYGDHVEPSIAAVSWLVAQGRSPYPLPGSADVFGFPYGPVLYITNGLVMRALGPSLAASKGAGIAAALVSLVCVAIACRREGRSMAAGLLLLVAGYLMFADASFWVRAEPLLLVLAGVALLGVTGSRGVGALLVGAALGFAVTTKVTAFLYLLPILAVGWRRWGLAWLLGVGLAAVAASAVPFVLAPQIEWASYAAWSRSAVRHGIRWRSVPSALEWGVFLSVASASALYLTGWSRLRLDDPRVVGRGVLVAVVCGTAVLAAKQGTGAHHFLPFLPTIALLEAWPRDDGLPLRWPGVTGGVLAAALTIAILQQADWIPPVATAGDQGIVDEVRSLVRTSAMPVAVGYGRSYRLSFLRGIPVFAGQPYQIDAVALMDARVSGDDVPELVVASIRACRFRTWLVAAGDDPFRLRSAYDPAVEVFGEPFVQAFRANYRPGAGSPHFDAWVCAH